MNDAERLDWLEANVMDLICNDADEWFCGFNVRKSLVEDGQWKPSLRDAVDAAIIEQDEQSQRGN